MQAEHPDPLVQLSQLGSHGTQCGLLSVVHVPLRYAFDEQALAVVQGWHVRSLVGVGAVAVYMPVVQFETSRQLLWPARL